MNLYLLGFPSFPHNSMVLDYISLYTYHDIMIYVDIIEKFWIFILEHIS